MRQDFDQSVSQGEALKRIPTCQTGHKHQHRPGPGKPRKQLNPMILARLRRLKARVKAYWKGEIDECP